MKQKWQSRLWLALGMVILCVAAAAARPMQAQAAQSYTVQGTVKDGTTADMLYLSTTSGQMEIKIDSSTDTTNCKVLLPGHTVTVDCYVGTDAYMHASKLSSGQNKAQVTVDATSPTVVQGTAASGTTEDILYLSTTGGTMQIKLDDTTDMSACKVLTLNKQLKVTCGRGSDGYLHATKIEDAAATTTLSIGGLSTTVIQGTVGDKTTSSLLYLSTNGGSMEIVLDLGTDISQCKVLTPGQSVTVAVYRGADAYMHAAQLVDNSGSAQASTATVNTASAVSVTGTVASGTTSQMLYLSTTGGMMQIKLDSTTTMSSGVLMIGKSVKVSSGGGSDGYLHAISVANG